MKSGFGFVLDVSKNLVQLLNGFKRSMVRRAKSEDPLVEKIRRLASIKDIHRIKNSYEDLYHDSIVNFIREIFSRGWFFRRFYKFEFGENIVGTMAECLIEAGPSFNNVKINWVFINDSVYFIVRNSGTYEKMPFAVNCNNPIFFDIIEEKIKPHIKPLNRTYVVFVLVPKIIYIVLVLSFVAACVSTVIGR